MTQICSFESLCSIFYRCPRSFPRIIQKFKLFTFISLDSCCSIKFLQRNMGNDGNQHEFLRDIMTYLMYVIRCHFLKKNQLLEYVIYGRINSDVGETAP